MLHGVYGFPAAPTDPCCTRSPVPLLPALPCPLALQDNVDVSFDSIIDLSAFSLRIPQADTEKLPEILLAVPEERRQEMRRNMARVWQRCGWGLSGVGLWQGWAGAADAGGTGATWWQLSAGPRFSTPSPLLCCRFTYSSYRPYAKRFREIQQRNSAGASGKAAEGQATERQAAEGQAGEGLSLPGMVPDLDPRADDAFGTIMAWLHSRIEATR